jgi:tripartite-type tricarboxylate transporter receptor subunit TctC
VEKWERGVQGASTDPEFISKAENAGFSADYADHATFRKRVLEEARMWQTLVKKLGIAPQ